MKKLICILIACFYFNTALVWATDYYWSTNGNDANWPCTSSGSPCQSTTELESRMGSFGGGDNIYFERGDIWTLSGRVDISASGTNDSTRLVFGAYGTGNRPVFDRNGGNDNVFSVEDQSYLTFENLKLTNSDTNKSLFRVKSLTGSGNGVHYVTWDNCHFDGGWGAIETDDSDYDDNQFTYLRIQNNYIANSGHDGTRTNNFNYVWITNNEYYNCNHNCIDSWYYGTAQATASNLVITGNLIHSFSNAIYLDHIDNITITGNIIRDSYTTDEDGQNGHTGIKIAEHGGANSNILIAGNIISDVVATGVSNCASIWISGGHSGEVTVYNNSIDGGCNCYYEFDNGSIAANDNNLIYGASSCTELEAQYGADPWTDADNNIFTLPSDSAARGAGADLGNGLNYGIDDGHTWPDNSEDPMDNEMSLIDFDSYDGGSWPDGAYAYGSTATNQIGTGTNQLGTGTNQIGVE